MSIIDKAIDVLESVTTAAEILQEYNPNHDAHGRFAGKGAGGFSSHAGNVDSHLAARVKSGADAGILKVGSARRRGAIEAEILSLDAEIDVRVGEIAAQFDGDARKHADRINNDRRIKRLRAKRKELADALADNERFSGGDT